MPWLLALGEKVNSAAGLGMVSCVIVYVLAVLNAMVALVTFHSVLHSAAATASPCLL
jgi:hypothetical protein